MLRSETFFGRDGSEQGVTAPVATGYTAQLNNMTAAGRRMLERRKAVRLTSEQIRQFEEEGYFFVSGCFSDEEKAIARQRRRWKVDANGITPHRTDLARRREEILNRGKSDEFGEDSRWREMRQSAASAWRHVTGPNVRDRIR